MNERTKYIDTRFGGNAADSLLQNEIDALDVEVQAEEERAKKEEKRLDEKIDVETERATSEEQRIEGRLDEEIDRAKSEEKRLDEKIDVETERATSEEQRIEDKLDGEIERSIAEDERLDQKVEDETARAQGSERALDEKIDAETERAQEAEHVLDGKIDKEIEDRIADVDAEEAARIAADEALDHKIDDETARAQEAERALDGKIDAETERAQEAERTLDGKIDKEIQDRIADVDNEETERMAADEALDQKIDKEIQDRIADVDAEEAARIAAVTAEAQAREEADAEEAQAREEADTKEAAARVLGDERLQDQIDTIEARSDVVDVVACYDRDDYEEPKPETDLVHYDTSTLSDNDVVKVLIDKTHDNSVSYYRWVITSASGEPTEGEWVFIGSVEAYYTKSETDAIVEELQGQIDKDIEVVEYQTTTPLTDEQVAKARVGKLAIYRANALYIMTGIGSGAVSFECMDYFTQSSASNFGSKLARTGYKVKLNLTTKLLSLENSGDDFVEDSVNNIFDETTVPTSDSRRIVRALNLRKTQDMIALVYDSSSTYAVGDYAIYQNNLYRCISAIETAEAFTAAHWEQVRAAEVNNEEKIEVVNYNIADSSANLPVLNSSQVEKAKRNKLVFYAYNGGLSQGYIYPVKFENNILTFKGMLAWNETDGSGVPKSTFAELLTIEYTVDENNIGHSKGRGGNGAPYIVVDTGANFFSSTVLPTSSGKRLVREQNLYKTQDMLAPVYDSTAIYSEGDYVIYQNDFYKCVSTITVAEAWTPAHWTKSSLSEMLDDIRTATELEILRLFREECTITSNITNGSASGDSIIWTEETASVTITANSGYSLPDEVTVTGASFTYDNTTGVVSLSDATGNVTITASCIPPMPAKGDIITLDNGTARYRVLKTRGAVAEVFALDDVANSRFNNSSTTTTFSDGSTGQKYENSTLDNYMNSTFYSSLSENVKAAIVQKSITQSIYQTIDHESSGYDFAIKGLGSHIECYTRLGQVSVGSRYCYALDVDDVAEYLGLGSGNTISGSYINDMFFEQTTSVDKSCWLSSTRSADPLYANYAFTVRGRDGYVIVNYYRNSGIARPAFQVDLSNLAWAKVPTKGDIITIDGGTARYRVLGVSGNEALLLAMDGYKGSSYNSSSVTKTFDGGKTGQKYEGSTLDTLLNETYYNSLSSNIRNAIVDQTRIQRMYSYHNSDDPSYDYHQQYDFDAGNMRGLKIEDKTTVGSRHVFALDIKDIFDYLGKDTMTSAELNEMFFESTSKVSKTVWLSSADRTYSDMVLDVRGDYGFVDYYFSYFSFVARPAFQVDISKLTWAKEE